MSARSLIQQMHAEAHATAQGVSEEGLYFVQTREHHMTIRLRKLRVGEQRRAGDLWLDDDNRLVPLGLRPWWKRLRGYGPVLDTHSDHYRALP